jgi:hypothetical protein
MPVKHPLQIYPLSPELSEFSDAVHTYYRRWDDCPCDHPGTYFPDTNIPANHFPEPSERFNHWHHIIPKESGRVFHPDFPDAF